MSRKSNTILNDNSIPATRRLAYAIGNARRSPGFVKAVIRDVTFTNADDPMIWFKAAKLPGQVTINLSF